MLPLSTGYEGLLDLMALDKCRRVPQVHVSSALQGISTPLCWKIWQQALVSHPDREFVEYIVADGRASQLAITIRLTSAKNVTRT